MFQVVNLIDQPVDFVFVHGFILGSLKLHFSVLRMELLKMMD